MRGIFDRGAEFLAARLGGIDAEFRAMRPGRGVITITRCDRYTDSNTEWVTKMTVLRKLRHSASRSLLSLKRVISSSAANGSSISRMSGSVTSARASDTRIFMPPESSRG